MSWLARTALLATLLVAVTLPLKLGVDRAPVDAIAETRAKTAKLGEFIRAQGVIGLSSAAPNRAEPYWTGWRFVVGSCRAVVFPGIGRADAFELLRKAKEPGMKTGFIYRGITRNEYPLWRVGSDQVITRLAWFAHPSHWRTPMLVILFYRGTCAPVLDWDWSPLWSGELLS